ncbi:hypothetical protein BC828DRAFT_409085 [Blastocladiella britannica]|nr:hypothetical protein BC828DRAFT_409085 [Blastocladiella britannica]
MSDLQLYCWAWWFTCASDERINDVGIRDGLMDPITTEEPKRGMSLCAKDKAPGQSGVTLRLFSGAAFDCCKPILLTLANAGIEFAVVGGRVHDDARALERNRPTRSHLLTVLTELMSCKVILLANGAATADNSMTLAAEVLHTRFGAGVVAAAITFPPSRISPLMIVLAADALSALFYRVTHANIMALLALQPVSTAASDEADTHALMPLEPFASLIQRITLSWLSPLIKQGLAVPDKSAAVTREYASHVRSGRVVWITTALTKWLVAYRIATGLAEGTPSHYLNLLLDFLGHRRSLPGLSI